MFRKFRLYVPTTCSSVVADIFILTNISSDSFRFCKRQHHAMDFSDMDSDAEEEEEERRMREMENLLYSQIHHQEECDGSAGIEEVAQERLQEFCDINETKKDSSKTAQESPRLTEEVVNAADSGVASLAASSPEPEFVDLASSDSDDEGIQGGI